MPGIKSRWPFKSKRVGQLKKDLALSNAKGEELQNELGDEQKVLELTKAEVSELLSNIDQQQDELTGLKKVPFAHVHTHTLYVPTRCSSVQSCDALQRSCQHCILDEGAKRVAFNCVAFQQPANSRIIQTYNGG